MIIDTHVHYNLSPLLENWQSHLKTAKKHGVTQSIVVGTDLASSQLAIDIAEQDPHLFATVGIHPHEMNHLVETRLIASLQDLIKNNLAKIVAIGEIGLDYHYQKNNHQRQLFISQIKLANEFNLPLSIHVRDAYDDALEILQQHPPASEFVLHCFSGDEHYVQEAIKLGAYFGVDGNITYKNAQKLRDLLKLIPPDKVLLETDAPYLPPEPHRGKTCEPWMISATAQYLKDNFGISEAQLAINSKNCFTRLNV